MKQASWLWEQIRFRRWMYGLSILLVVTEGVCQLATVGLQKWLIDDIIMQGQYEKLPTVIWMLAGAFVAYGVFFTAAPFVMRKNEILLFTGLQGRLLFVLQHIPLGVFRKEPTTRYQHYFSNDISQVSNVIAMRIPQLLQSAIIAVVLTGIVGFVSPVLLLVVVALTVAYYLVGHFYGPKLKAVSKEVHERKSDLLIHVEEGIASTREVVAYHRRDWEKGIYNRLFGRVLERVVAEGKMENKMSLISDPLKWGANIAVLGYGAWGVMQGSITLGVFVIMLQFTTQLVESYHKIFDGVKFLYSSGGLFERLQGALKLDVKPEGKAALGEDIELIALDEVTFSYQEESSPVLRNVSLHFPAGQKIAVVGSSGSGKSTVAQLLMRLYDPNAGKLTVNGQDLQGVRRADWLQRVAVVPQEPYFFPETIRTNLLLGLEGVTEEQVRNACRIAQIDGMIDELPDGLDTRVGERGIALSGGQRQRLAIARAILTNPQVLVLDEATSALDSETERSIQQALDAHLAGSTMIVIAHRLTTIENADLIYVLDAGRVVEQGTHEVLMEGNTVYKSLFTAQVLSA